MAEGSERRGSSAEKEVGEILNTTVEKASRGKLLQMSWLSAGKPAGSVSMRTELQQCEHACSVRGAQTPEAGGQKGSNER